MKNLLTTFTKGAACLFATGIFCPEQIMPQSAGDQFFGQWIHEIRVTFSQPAWKDSLAYYENINDTATTQIYLSGDVMLDGVVYNNIGVKYKGNSSYNISSDKKSFKISFDKFVNGQKPDGLKKINLNNGFKDPTFLREKFMLDFLRQEGLHAPRCVYANLYINNQHYGFYSVVEEVDDAPFLLNEFGNKTGNLFKGDPNGTLVWKGNNVSLYYPDYELHNNEDVNDWSDLLRLIKIINQVPSSSLVDSLEEVLNIEAYVAHRAANILFMNLDSYDGSGHNYFIYNNLGKFEWMAWDVNETFGNFNMGLSISQMECLSAFFHTNSPSSRPLPSRLLVSGNNFSSYYAFLLSQWLQKWPPAKFDAWIDSMAQVIRPMVYNDPMKFYSNAHFESALNQNTIIPGIGFSGNFMSPGLKSFYANRWNCLTQELQSLSYWSVPHFDYGVDILISPNPAGDYVSISGKIPSHYVWGLFNTNGEQIRAGMTHASGNEGIFLNINDVPAGLYVFRLTDNLSGRLVASQRIIKL